MKYALDIEGQLITNLYSTGDLMERLHVSHTTIQRWQGILGIVELRSRQGERWYTQWMLDRLLWYYEKRNGHAPPIY